MKGLLIRWLTLLAQRVVRKYQSDLIGITGSVGKTTTKEAIAQVLEPDYRLRKSAKNYNNELGVPLTVIGAHAPGRSPAAWFGVFWKATRLLIWRDKHYPKLLVLEMGSDKPGDIKHLTTRFPCRVGVLTAIGPAHLEFFTSIEAIAEEKAVLVRHLAADGFAVLNADDPRVVALAKGLKAPVALYGFSKRAEVRASEPRFVFAEEKMVADAIRGEGLPGLEARVTYGGKTTTLTVPHVVGKHTVSSLLAVMAVGLAFDVGLEESARRLRDFAPPPGRLRLLRGMNRSLILDDSYNASTPAVLEALETLKVLPANGRRIAALGEMAELGAASKEGHRAVGERVAAICQMLVTVGENAKVIAKAANKAGMHAEKIFSLPTSREASDFLARHVQYGDVVLVKGSQISRTERIVKRLMAEPMRAGELLVRQGREWERK